MVSTSSLISKSSNPYTSSLFDCYEHTNNNFHIVTFMFRNFLVL